MAFKHLFQITVGPKEIIHVQSRGGPYEARGGNKTSRCVGTAAVTENTVPHFKGDESIGIRSDHKKCK